MLDLCRTLSGEDHRSCALVVEGAWAAGSLVAEGMEHSAAETWCRMTALDHCSPYLLTTPRTFAAAGSGRLVERQMMVGDPGGLEIEGESPCREDGSKPKNRCTVAAPPSADVHFDAWGG